MIQMRTVGGNEKATKLSGINTNKVYFLAYTNMGLLSALAAMVTIARLSSAQPTYGQNYEMDAIGSCFIGGASAYGGVGTVPGVIVGAILMGSSFLVSSCLGASSCLVSVLAQPTRQPRTITRQSRMQTSFFIRFLLFNNICELPVSG